MTPKPASVNEHVKEEASHEEASVSPPGDSELDNDAVNGLETSRSAGESYDDSLEAILVQAGTRPPEPATSKLLGSKTLMGLGIDGLNLTGFRGVGRPDAAAEGGEAAIDVDERSEADDAKGRDSADLKTKSTGAISSENTPEVTSLLDEVAQALNVQANEHRDRARGRLPGMPSQAAAAEKVPGPARAQPGQIEVEFEDPDDGPTALTPDISVVDGHEAEELDDLAAENRPPDLGDGVVAPPEFTGTGKPKDAKSGDRPVLFPPIPGLSLTAAPPQVGPPPGLPTRPPTPATGLAPPPSGRVRLPTPMPGLPIPRLPTPAGGRLTLAPGTAGVPGRTQAASDLPAAASAIPTTLEGSHRSSRGLGAGRASTTRGARITEQLVPVASSLTAVLTAHVKLATVSLAGLIAVTFAGGLFVGMLVWKGQGRSDLGPTGRIAANAGTLSVPTAPTTADPATAPKERASTPPGTTAAANPANPIPAAGAPQTDAVVTPLGVGSPSDDSMVVPKPVHRLAVPPRPRRPPAIPTVADTAALFPKAFAPKPTAQPATPAGGPASKSMANNAAAKPAAKSKAKSTWHDPFAD